MRKSASWSVSFILPGIVISLPSGFLGRRFGDKTVVVYGMALMVAGGAVATFGWSYPTILVGHALAGVGGAILIVLMSKMLTDWFARKELFLGNAIFIVGWPAGIAAGQATQSRIAELISWHTVFASSTALVALALVLMILFYHRPPDLAEPATEAIQETHLAGSQDHLPCRHHLDVPERRLSGDPQLRAAAPDRARRRRSPRRTRSSA